MGGSILTQKFGESRRSALTLLITCLFVVAVLNGCDSASSYQYVDFQDKVEVDRPSEGATSRSPLKVAVAAMVSPRETFQYYQALLDYLAAKMDQPIELVQRVIGTHVSHIVGIGTESLHGLLP